MRRPQPVCLRPGREHDPVEYALAELLVEPPEMLHDGWRDMAEFAAARHLIGHRPAVEIRAGTGPKSRAGSEGILP